MEEKEQKIQENQKIEFDIDEHKTPDLRFSFDIEIPQQRRFYFKLDDLGQPIKLGDGTFGIVFEVYDSLNNEYAVKLLYSDQESKRSKARFKSEMESSRLIKQFLKDRNDFAGVVETEGGTTCFQNSLAYQSLASFLEPLSISNYALVMPKYERTLKQILEEDRKQLYTLPSSDSLVKTYFLGDPVIDEYSLLEDQIDSTIDQLTVLEDDERKRIKKELKAKIYPITGYEALKRMSFDERINNMQPYIYEVAQGLKTLHCVNLLHLDLKPANIFVKRQGTKIQAVIGDLGFLDEAKREFLDAPHRPYYEKAGRPSLPLGTRHYRSPEQKDFFDVADVEVIVRDDIELIVKDPKFHDTIIESGDIVLFSKYQAEYEIDKVISEELGENTSFRILLKKDQLVRNHVIQKDKRTQVYFYKRQRHRTDLFGFGALIFELLTCGKSPERFYDAIRGYDNHKQNVASIMDLYRQISNFQSTEPGLVQIFEPFKLNESSTIYAPTEIVELILKCMLYKAGNTFYSHEQEVKDQGSTMESVIKYLQGRLYYSAYNRFERLDLITNNVLYNLNKTKAVSLKNQTDFSDVLTNLESYSEDDFPRRLYKGIQCLKKIIDLVQTFGSNDGVYFLELGPQNITKDQSTLAPKYIVYENQEGYVEDLEKDFVHTKVSRNISNPYVPNFLSFIRRTIQLEKVRYNINKSPRTLDCVSYQFSDSSPYGDTLEAGDWIVLSWRGNNYLWKICDIADSEGQKMRLIVPPEKEPQRERYEEAFKGMEESRIEAVFYKALSPTAYYLNLLGIYIYHLFFVGLSGNGNDKPAIESSLRSMGTQLVEKIRIKSLEAELNEIADLKTGFFGRPIGRKSSRASSKEEKVKQITLTLAWMYAKLIFVESQDSYLSEKQNIRECIIAVKDSIFKLKAQVADLLDFEVVRLDESSDQLESSLPQLSKDFGVETAKICFSFNKLISHLITIPGNSQEAYLKDIFER